MGSCQGCWRLSPEKSGELSRRCAHLDPSCGFMGQGKDERLCVGSREQTCQREISALNCPGAQSPGRFCHEVCHTGDIKLVEK